MKICFLAPANSIHSHRWIKYFADKGHEVHWISIYPLEFEQVSAIHYYQISYKNWFLDFFRIVRQVRKLIRSIHPDVLHIHSLGVYGTVGILSGFHPVIVTAWGSDVLITGKTWLRRPLLKDVLRKADLITCDADHMIEAMGRIGTPRQKMRIVYFGVDTKMFHPGPKNESLRMELDFDDSPTVISLRSLSPIYDIETLIEAIPMVLRSTPTAKFLVAGTGPSKTKLIELARTRGVSANVKFVGKIIGEKLPEYLRFADIYVSTSLSDAGIASSTAEAMACGKPVVVTDSGENRKWVNDGHGGFVVPVKSPDILARKIVDLIMDENLRASFGMFNRQVIMERNDYCKEMNKMEEIYSSLIAKQMSKN